MSWLKNGKLHRNKFVFLELFLRVSFLSGQDCYLFQHNVCSMVLKCVLRFFLFVLFFVPKETLSQDLTDNCSFLVLSTECPVTVVLQV